MANLSLVNSTNFAAQLALGSSYQSVIVAAASSLTFTNPPTYPGLKRGKIYDILVGTNTTPADNYVEYSLNRCTVTTTAAITGAVSSVSSLTFIDPGDVAAGSFLAVNTSAGSSVPVSQGANLWYVGVNQRASYRWVAAPGSEFVYPAISSASGVNGLTLMARSGSYTGTVTNTVLLSEQ